MTSRTNHQLYLETTPEYLDAIQKKYQVIDCINLLSVDSDFELLETWLIQNKQEVYQPTQRYVIEHFDTDYYLEDFPYGLGLYNLFKVFKKLDIPLFTMLLITNSFGIEKEVEMLAPNVNDRPTVISTFISRLHYTNLYQDVDIDSSKIIIPGICMMGQPRVHRHALYEFFKSNSLLNLIAVSKK